MGPSGSGKSTLMNIIGCLDRATTGRYLLDGVDVEGLSDNELAAIRLRKLGFVFQGFNLLARTDALKNVALPLFYANVPTKVRNQRAQAALAEVGLADRSHHQPNQLSGASSSASPSHAPSSTTRPCCSPTSRPGTWIPRPARS